MHHMTEPTPVKQAGDATESDETLIGRVATGDRRAFARFMDRHGDFIYATAVRLTGNRADAQDAVQDTFLRVWRNAGSWRPDGGAAVRTWLYRIAHNVCIDMLRKRRPQNVLSETIDSGVATDSAVQEQETKAAVTNALRQLPERQRAVLVLCHYQGLSNAEAATMIGTTVKGVESLLIRARRQMRDILKPLHNGL